MILAIILLSPFCYKALANDQIKSTIFLVDSGSSQSEISSPVDLAVSFYIGDDLIDVSNSVKRALFRVSGVYTGGGSLQFKIDSDNATAKTFTLPNVSRPTDFELIYDDDSGKINPTSAGSYSRILNVVPSGVAISGLAAKLEITHQFATTACADGQASNEKVKTTEFYVGQINALGASIDMPVSIYIGDNLLDVVNPVKSVYFLVSGVYTGSGSMTMDINSSGQSKNFNFSNIASPSNFSFIYKDNSGIISPNSAGVYGYNLNISQSGLTVSNLSVKAVLTHRYKPACSGAGYKAHGELISAVYEPTANADGPAYNSIMWKGKLGGTNLEGKVRFQIAVSPSSLGPWSYLGGDTCSANDWYETASPSEQIELNCPELNNKKYLRYKIQICSSADCLTSGTETPEVEEVIVNWSP